MNTNQEQIIFEIISYAGEARALSFEALRSARQGSIAEAETLLENASETLRKVHGIQTSLIQHELDGDGSSVMLLMVHAQDHLMTAMLAFDLITEMVEQYKQAHSK